MQFHTWGAMGAAAPGPAILGTCNFEKYKSFLLCAVCEIYYAATGPELY